MLINHFIANFRNSKFLKYYLIYIPEKQYNFYYIILYCYTVESLLNETVLANKQDWLKSLPKNFVSIKNND